MELQSEFKFWDKTKDIVDQYIDIIPVDKKVKIVKRKPVGLSTLD